MISKSLFLLLSFAFFFSTGSVAKPLKQEGLRFLFAEDDPEVEELLSLIDMTGFSTSPGKQKEILGKKLKNSKMILTLGDGFAKGKHSLAEVIQASAPKKAVVIKSGYDAPNRVRVQSNGIVQLKQDHQKGITFFDSNELDQILMRRGLCHCNGQGTTCGGLRMCDSQDSERLFRSIAVSLDQNNPHSMAFLNGWHLFKHHKLESEAQSRFEEALRKLEKEFPALEMRMIYLNYPREKTYLSEEPVAPSTESKEVQPKLVPVFIGVQMRMRPGGPSAPLKIPEIPDMKATIPATGNSDPRASETQHKSSEAVSTGIETRVETGESRLAH